MGALGQALCLARSTSFNECLKEKGWLSLRNWNRLIDLQIIVWKLAGDWGTFDEYIQRTKYKEFLVDVFYTVSERLHNTWRAIMSTKFRVGHESDKTREDKNSDSILHQGEDDDVTVGVSNCVADRRGNKWKS